MGKEWERKEGESLKAFTAWNTYLSMGDNRSITLVASKLDKSRHLISRWCAKYDWNSRLNAYSKHFEIVEREATEAMTRMKASEWVQRQNEHREDEWQVRCELIKAGREALKRYIANPARVGTLEGITRMLELASKLGRLASGLATDHTEVSGQINHTLDPEWDRALKTVYGEVIDVEPKRIDDGTKEN